MKKLLIFITSRAFLRSLLIAISIILVFLVFTFSCIKVYTQHGKSYAVENYIDLHLNVAAKKIEDRKFRYVVYDSLYVPEKEPGIVIEQLPQPGALVKKNRRVFLTINASGPEKIAIPDFRELSLNEGRARLASTGLVLGRLLYRYDLSKNIILEQRVDGKTIEPGDSILKGSSVDFVIGRGLSTEKAKVPDLIGLTVDQAKQRVENNMFSLGAIVPDDTVVETEEEIADSLKPKIFRQSPVSSPEVLVALGSTISIWITTNPEKLPQPETDEEENFILPDDSENDEKDTTSTMSY